MIFHLIHTYRPGPRIESGSLTRAAIARICKRLTEQWGFDVLPESKVDGFIMIYAPIGYKSVRIHSNNDRIPWIIGNEMEVWANDETVVFSDLEDGSTYLKAFDGATWKPQEVIDIVEALQSEGVIVKKSTIPRLFKPYMDKRRLYDLWAEKTRGLAPGEIITDEATLGLLSFGGVIGNDIRFGSEGVSIEKCVEGYIATYNL